MYHGAMSDGCLLLLYSENLFCRLFSGIRDTFGANERYDWSHLLVSFLVRLRST